MDTQRHLRALVGRRRGSRTGLTMVVSGPAGSGKSAVARVLEHDAWSSGMRTLTVQAAPPALALPGHVSHTLQSAPVVKGPQRQHDLPRTSGLGSGTTIGRRDLAWQLFTMRIAPGPDLVVVIEDVHHCDEEDLRALPGLVRQLVSAGATVVLTTAAASGALDHGFATSVPSRAIVRLTLAPWDPTDCATLLRTAFDSEVDEQDSDDLRTLTGGNPAALASVARLLACRDGVHRLDRCVVLARDVLDAIVLPPEHPLLTPVRELGPTVWRLACTIAQAPLLRTQDVPIVATAARVSVDLARTVVTQLSATGALQGSSVLRFSAPLLRTSLAAHLAAASRDRVQALFAQHLLTLVSDATLEVDAELTDWLIEQHSYLPTARLSAVIQGRADAHINAAQRVRWLGALFDSGQEGTVEAAWSRLIGAYAELGCTKQVTETGLRALRRGVDAHEASVVVGHVARAYVMNGELTQAEHALSAAAPLLTPSSLATHRAMLRTMTGRVGPTAVPPSALSNELAGWLPRPMQRHIARSWKAGRWDEVLSLARRAMVPVAPAPDPSVVRDVAATAAEVLVQRGRAGQAQFFLRAAQATGGWTPRLAWVQTGYHQLVGETTHAADGVEQGICSAALGVCDGDLLLSRAIEMDVDNDDLTRARRHLGDLQRVHAALGSARSRLLLARAHAIVEANPDAAQLALALAWHRHQPYELARTALVAGELGLDTARSLRLALRLFTALDAGPWRCRTDSAMVKAGCALGSTPHTTGINERLLAALVADGLPNRQIARVLHCSEKTVEGRLRRMLKTRGLATRTELAAAVASGAFDALVRRHPEATLPLPRRECPA